MIDFGTLYGGFRERLLDYAELSAQLDRWAKAFPELVDLRSLATTPEGRELWLLTIGSSGLDPGRPMAWVDANMHAAELAGSSACLAIAEDLLRLHRGDSPASLEGLPPHVRDALARIQVAICPRISPDGAEAVLRDGRYVRSVPRDRRQPTHRPRWIAEDIDGDGLALVMRIEDPTGEFVESAEVPGLLVERRLEDEGPFYKVYPEGRIEHWDGNTIPDPGFLSDNEPDLNRNFPYQWAPEPLQTGAGRFPLSEIESRAVVEYVVEHPNLFLWLNLHCFGGVHIRPLGHAPDTKMNPADLALYRQIETWADELTGYPTVSGFEEFTYEPETRLHGDLIDFAYHQRGCVAWVCEIWDLFTQVGLPAKKRFVDRYKQLDRADLEAIGRWDREHNQSRVLRPWRPAEHPQLGSVEVGGIDPRFGMWNPPFERLGEVCDGLAGLFLRTAALAPQVVARAEVASRCGETRQVTLHIENRGYLPTNVLATAKDLPFAEPLFVEVEAAGCELTSPSDAHREVGHLDGWGRGRWSGLSALYYQRSRGSISRRVLRWTVRGEGLLTFRIRSSRTGTVVECLEVR